MAKERNPTSDLRSTYGVESLVSIAVTASRAYYSLARGRRASITNKSSSIPKNLAVVPAMLFLLLIVKLRL